MTEPRRFQAQYKMGPHTAGTLAIHRQQMALYAQGLNLKPLVPEPCGEPVVNYPALEEIRQLAMATYSLEDVAFTVKWWQKFNVGEPVLINKLRGRAQGAIFSLNDLVWPETIRAMAAHTTSQPLYDDDSYVYSGCGCVR